MSNIGDMIESLFPAFIFIPFIAFIIVTRVLGRALSKQTTQRDSSGRPANRPGVPQPGLHPASRQGASNHRAAVSSRHQISSASVPDPAEIPKDQEQPLTVLSLNRNNRNKKATISVPLTASALQQAVVMKEILDRPRFRTGGRVR